MGFLLGEHGFTKQPISAKAILGAGFKFVQKKSENMTYCVVEVEEKKFVI